MINQSGKGTNSISAVAPAQKSFFPPPVTTLEQTGLSALWLQDLILKVMYFQGYSTGFKIAEDIALPFTGIVDHLLDILKEKNWLK